MSGYLLNIALRGAGLYPMNSIRPRKGIFESSNVAAPLINSIQNEKNSDRPGILHNPTERTEPVSRDVPPPDKVEAHPATPGAPPDSLPTDSLTDPVVEDFVAPMLTSNEKTSKATHPEMQNTEIETEPLRDVAHTLRPALNSKLSVGSIKAAGPSPQLYGETQLDPHTPQHTIVSSKTEENEIKEESGITSHLSTSETRSKNLITVPPETVKRKGNTPNGSAISEPSPANDVAEDLKKYTSIKNNVSTDAPANYHEASSPSPAQSYVKDIQKNIKPVSQSKIEQTTITPIRQIPFSKVRSVIKNNVSTDAPANYHEASSPSPAQSYVKDIQKNIKPVSQSKIEQTTITPIRQIPFSKVRSVIKKAAIQPEARQTVKVNIGKVEVRAAQTQQPLSASPPPAPVRSGFDDYLLVRNYGFLEH